HLDVFEAMAILGPWPQAQWASYLLPQLTGETQAAARTLSPAAMMDFPTLKAAILNGMGPTPEGYRKKFQEEVFANNEHPRVIAHRLWDYAVGWLNQDATTKERMLEVIVVDRF
ncbi:SCAN domain-containing protein 1-like, partial [Huso huso]